MNEERELNQRSLAFLIYTVKNVAEEYEEKSETLKKHLGDYLTSDIATEWEKSFLDLVYKLFDQKVLTQKQVSLFEKIEERFLNASTNGKLYEKEIWTLEGLKNHSFWQEQRRLAKELLAELEKIIID